MPISVEQVEVPETTAIEQEQLPLLPTKGNVVFPSMMVPLLIMLGFTPQKAVGTSFLAILIISLSALLAHAKLAHVDYRLGIALGIGGLVGAQIGARILPHVSAATFNKIFAVILLALAVRMFLQR